MLKKKVFTKAFVTFFFNMEGTLMKTLRVYQLSVQFYRECQSLSIAAHLKNQLLRAASSITLNISEGYGKSTRADRKHYWQISFGSIRESQAILDLALNDSTKTVNSTLDH